MAETSSEAPGLRKRLLSVKRPYHQAVVGAHVSSTHSLDYEIIDSAVNREEELKIDVALEYNALKWINAIVIGVATGAIAFFINMVVENFVGFKLSHTVELMQQGRPWLALAVYSAVSVALVAFSAILCAYVAPAAGGSGIPEVKAYLNGVDLPQALSLPTLLVKIFGSIGSVAGGLALGKEGPLVHIGACIGNLMGQEVNGGKVQFLNFFSNDKGRRDLVTVGGGAGVAAAFQCPVAGVLFALEELTSWWKKQLVWKALFTNAVGAVVLRTLMALCSGNYCGTYSGGGFVIFNAQRQTDFGVLELLPVALLGVIGGLLGAAFNAIYTVIAKNRAKNIFSRGAAFKVLEAVAIAVVTAGLNFGLPYFSPCLQCPAGVPCPSPDLEGKYIQYSCPAGHYSDMASLAPITNDNTIKNLFSSTPSIFTPSSLVVYLVAFFGMAVVTHGCAVPAGLFVPDILIGALYGRLVGIYMRYVTGGVGGLDEGTYALLGAASFLSGSMRMTVSLSVMLLEVTGNLLLLPLIMLTTTIAKEIGDTFNEGIVDINLKLKKLPLLEPVPEPFMATKTVADAVGTDVVWFKAVEKVSTIVNTLLETGHSAFPVVEPLDDGSGQKVLTGLILRSHLKVVLQDKAELFAEDPYLPENEHLLTKEEPRVPRSRGEFAHSAKGRHLKVANISFTPEELEMFVNLRPFVNTSPHIVAEDMSLRKAYMMFQRLGLSHMCVVEEKQKIVGMITRRDLLPSTFEERDIIEEDESIEGRVRRSSMMDI